MSALQIYFACIDYIWSLCHFIMLALIVRELRELNRK